MPTSDLPSVGADPRLGKSATAKVSIVINNYNYGRFLRRAIDSALGQEDENFEIIVVDDGSTDDSVSVARERLDARLRVISKANGGQASALNAGFAASDGDWVMFLDSDDWYEPGALRRLRSEFQEGVAKVHFPLTRYYETTGKQGGVFPRHLSRGSVIQEIAESGNYVWPPTSGNIFRREALKKVMPIPEKEYTICADTYLCLMVSALGTIASVDSPLGFYCVHGANAYGQVSFRFENKYLASQAVGHLRISRVAERVLSERGVAAKLTELDRRENIEIVAIAARFGAIRPEDFGLTPEKIVRHWTVAYEHSPDTLRSRAPALFIWKIINYAPRPVVKIFMQLIASFRTRRFNRECMSGLS
jgi:glycosyltransferase involved in cell wall biosynthesis